MSENVREPVERALAFVLKSTSARPQTEAEISGKLRGRGHEPDVVTEVLALARERGAIDDHAFARAWVRDRGEVRGYGMMRLRQELRRRLVPDHLVDAALATLEDRDELAVATELARVRAGRLPASLPPEAVARRLGGFLVRRGYPPGLAQRVGAEVAGLARAWD